MKGKRTKATDIYVGVFDLRSDLSLVTIGINSE